MAIFNFLENFFFISLAITFGLLLLLVYHFKERMSLVEKKSDTMNEIITNVVKEMKNLRMAMIQQQEKPFGVGPHQISPVPIVQNVPVVKHEQPPVVNIPFTQPHIEYSIKEYDNQEVKPSKIVVSDDSESETETESESSDSESNTEAMDDSSDDESDKESDKESDVESEDESVSDADSDTETVDLGIQEIDDIQTHSETDAKPETDTKLQHISLDELQIENIDEQIQANTVAQQMAALAMIKASSESVSSPPVVTHLPEVKHDDLSAPTPEIVLPEKKMEEQLLTTPTINRVVVEQIEPKDPKREVYRKMNINQLRTIAISSGLTQDTSKMKKNELIKLLEALDDE